MREIVLSSLIGAVSAVVLLAVVKEMTPPAVTLPLKEWACTRVEMVSSVEIDPAVQTRAQFSPPRPRCVVYEKTGWR